MDSEAKLEVINAHPRIGQKDASKLSKFSKIEQGMAEESKVISVEEQKILEDFKNLNAECGKNKMLISVLFSHDIYLHIKIMNTL
mmetsp:Transcript_37205/g.59763  ORF Transcript_37205/g.59763 Transcript_37205/m.59763 type:complete len:85 (+) Transcript_37205:296-550(+)